MTEKKRKMNDNILNLGVVLGKKLSEWRTAHGYKLYTIANEEGTRMENIQNVENGGGMAGSLLAYFDFIEKKDKGQLINIIDEWRNECLPTPEKQKVVTVSSPKREYEIIPKKWDEDKQDFVSDFDNSEICDIYFDAVRAAKSLSKSYDRVDIEFYKLARRSCRSEEEFNNKWQYDHAACLQWRESFEHGRQCPVIQNDGNNIWRWNMQEGSEDLKPQD